MRLPANPNVGHPQLDTRFHIHATDGNGKLILHEVTGEPMHIAQDLLSGNWYAKVADSFPRLSSVPTPTQLAATEALVDAGAVHVPHETERFRGVWVPLAGEETELDLVGTIPEKPSQAESTNVSHPTRATASKKAATKTTRRVN